MYSPRLSLANNNSKCVHDRSLSARDIISLVQHYPSLEGRPEQCFFFDTCGKLVSQKKSIKISILIQITRILYVIQFFSGIFYIVQMTKVQKQVSKTRQKILFENVTLFSYLIFVISFTQAKFLENKIYTKKTRKLGQNTQ